MSTRLGALGESGKNVTPNGEKSQEKTRKKTKNARFWAFFCLFFVKNDRFFSLI
jgi:hypothetical protein